MSSQIIRSRIETRSGQYAQNREANLARLETLAGAHETATLGGGQKYVGQWANDKRNGEGTYTFPSGEKYVGGFKNGDYHGHATHHFKTGKVFVGEYKNDKRNG